MPIVDGLELRQRINASEYFKRKAIPFVFLTTAATEEWVQKAFDATVPGFYQKAPK